MDLLTRLAYRNVKNHWKQSFAALISVTIGFIAFSLFDGYLLDGYRGITEFFENIHLYGDLIIEHNGASSPEGRTHPWDWALNSEEQKQIAKYLESQNTKILAYSRFLKIDGSVDSQDNSFGFNGFGYEVNPGDKILGRWNWNTYWGKPLIQQSNPNSMMIIGRRLGQFLNCLPDELEHMNRYLLDLEYHPTDRPFTCVGSSFQLTSVTEKGQVNALDLSVSGLYDEGFKEFDERFVSMPLETAQALFDTDKVHYYTLKLNKGFDKRTFIQNFREYFKTVNPEIVIEDWKLHPFGDVYRRTKSLLDVDRTFVISIIIFVGCLSVFNTLVKIINERTFEIGMLRSLGFTPAFIQKLFILEAVFLSWLGCFWGIIISFLLSTLINYLEISYASGLFSFDSPLRIQLEFLTYIQGFIMMTCLSLLAAYIAVRKPSKAIIAQSLIHT